MNYENTDLSRDMTEEKGDYTDLCQCVSCDYVIALDTELSSFALVG